MSANLAARSFGLDAQRRADVHVVVDHAPDVDERLDTGEDDEDLHREDELAVVPVGDAHDRRLEQHAQQDRREQPRGEAGPPGAVVDRDAVDVGADVHHAHGGRQRQPHRPSVLRGEEPAQDGDEGEEARRHLAELSEIAGGRPPSAEEAYEEEHRRWGTHNEDRKKKIKPKKTLLFEGLRCNLPGLFVA
jgi:hypothetical protein